MRLLTILVLLLGLFGCDRKAAEPSADVDAALLALRPPVLGGSAQLGEGRGLVILDPTDPVRPFFRDFGRIPRGESREWRIRLLNQDPEPVDVKDAVGACGCMGVRGLRARLADGTEISGDTYRSEPPLLTVPPGAVLELDLAITTDRIQPNTDKLAVFRMTTSSLISPYITFEAHLIAADSFNATPHEFQFGDVPQGYGGRKQVRILAEPRGSAAKILGIAEQGKRVTATFDEVFFGGEFVWHVVAEIPPLEPLGAVRDTIILRTTDADGNGDSGRMKLDVYAAIVRDIRIAPPLIAFGAVRADEKAPLVREGTVDALVPGARTRVLGHRLSGPSAPHLSVKFTPTDPDDVGRAVSTRIEVELAPGHPVGPIAADLTVEMDDVATPTVSVKVSGVVRG